MRFLTNVLRDCGALPGLFVIVLASAATAMVVPMLLDDLIEQSDVIVHGTVADLESRREAEGPEIYTIVTLDVSKLVLSRGNGGERTEVTFRIEGGTVDGETMATSISPELDEGDEGVFFLTRQAGEDVLSLVGGQQGYVPVDDGSVTVEGRQQPIEDFLDDLARRVQ
jgi:hypothetical protein